MSYRMVCVITTSTTTTTQQNIEEKKKRVGKKNLNVASLASTMGHGYVRNIPSFSIT